MEQTDYSESIEKSKRFIKSHINDNLSAEIIAENAGYSVFHFCRIFKKYSGRTLMQYVRDLRLENAAKEVKNGARICEAAQSCGYETSGGFSRAYKKKYGKNPGIKQP